MSIMKRGSLYLLLAVFLLVLTNVSALQVGMTPVQGEVLQGQGPTYIIHVTNDDGSTESVTIKSIDLTWMMDKDNTQYLLQPGETKDIAISYVPRDLTLEAGLYGINFQASAGNIKETKLLPVDVLDYTDLLNAQFASLPVIDPRRPSSATLKILNLHSIPLDNVQVDASSPYLSLQQSVSLPSKSSQDLPLPVKLDPNTPEGTYELRVKITSGGHLLLDKGFPYVIGKYVQGKELVEPQNGIFSVGEQYSKRNDGNAVLTETYTKEFNRFSYMFTSFTPQPTHLDLADGKRIAVWEYTLQPGQSMTISYSTRYGGSLLLAILIIAGLFFFVKVRKRDLTVRKRVLVLHTRQGGIAVLKVIVSVKNTGSSALQQVDVVDRVPHILKAPSDFGMHKPDQVKHSPESINLYWMIPQLPRGGERLFSYKIESKGKLPASLMLSAASAKVTIGKKRVLASSGNAAIKPVA